MLGSKHGGWGLNKKASEGHSLALLLDLPAEIFLGSPPYSIKVTNRVTTCSLCSLITSKTKIVVCIQFGLKFLDISISRSGSLLLSFQTLKPIHAMQYCGMIVS